MGWTNFNQKEPVKEWFKKQWSDHAEVFDIALVKRNTLYAAVKMKDTDEIFCVVYLIRWARGYYNFSYKDMTEFAGPCESECPRRIMKLLTPLNDKNDPKGWAREWRKRVNEHWSKSDKLKKSKDCIIKTETPISFTNGSEYQYFQKKGSITVAGVMINYKFEPYCRVRANFKNLNYELIENNLDIK